MSLPGPLCLPSAFPFVGRARELQALRSALSDAGHNVVLIGGEAGSGKSRLIREFAAEADARGALVLYGACDAVVRAPYGPFVEAFDQLARELGPEALAAALGPTGGELSRLLPWGGEPADADPDTVRHRLHTAVTDLLDGASTERPVVLVLEDAHWGDNPTLGLLRHLARAGGRARLLLLATFRETELPDALSETLADLRRSEEVIRLRLAGLSGEEVGEFVRAAGARADSDLARAITDLTGGNAFLVCELWRALVDTGELGTPESVREVVGGRLARLRPQTGELLQLAAAAGPEFGLEVLRGAPDLAASLEEAVRSGMIEELPSVRIAYRFTHELVRRALYDELTAVRRAELHLRVGEALESTGTAAELAHHFTIAAALAGPERGIAYNVRAAREAASALAFDEASERLETALELGVNDPRERAALLIELGAIRNRAGRAVDALAAFAEAASLTDDPELLARAAIGYEEACWRPVITDELAVELLTRASAALSDEPSRLRVGVLGGLARALQMRGQQAAGAGVRSRAVAMAREIDDPRALAQVLVGSYWSRATISSEAVLEQLTEARDIAARLGDVELYTEAMNWRISALLALGRIDAARFEVARVRATAERIAQPFHLHVAEHCGSAIALCEGRLADAEAMAERSHEWTRLLTGRDASGVYGIQMFGVRREQGRLDELAPVVRLLAARGGHWRPGLASLLVELGMEDEARAVLSELVTEGLDAFRASLWLSALTYLTDACAGLGDAAMAALVYPELEPLEGEYVVIGHGVACYGAVDRYLGMLAATLEEWDAAERHFESALSAHRRMGADTWLAHTAYEYGRMLVSRGGARERAAGLLAEADALAERIGMAALRARIARVGAVRAAEPPDGLSFREVQILALVAEGLSNREIGASLFISEHTAANHIRSILRKTRCGNRTEAASYAHLHGLVARR